MIYTTYDLICKFNCSTGYTHSDEITLIFDKNSNIFEGKVYKIITSISSYCSIRFNYHFIYQM